MDRCHILWVVCSVMATWMVLYLWMVRGFNKIQLGIYYRWDNFSSPQTNHVLILPVMAGACDELTPSGDIGLWFYLVNIYSLQVDRSTGLKTLNMNHMHLEN